MCVREPASANQGWNSAATSADFEATVSDAWSDRHVEVSGLTWKVSCIRSIVRWAIGPPSTPSGVHSSYNSPLRVGEQDGHTIGRPDAYAHSGRRGDQCVALAYATTSVGYMHSRVDLLETCVAPRPVG